MMIPTDANITISLPGNITLLSSELKFSFIRAPGPGGQNVNKVATAVLLRFNIVHSTSLPEDVRQRLLTQLGKKLTATGDFLIKACLFRSQARNKQDALARLQTVITKAISPVKKRKKTKPSKAALQRRQDEKKLQARKKIQRRPLRDDH